MDNSIATTERVDELLAFLPYIHILENMPVGEWLTLDPISFAFGPNYNYPEELDRFIKCASQSCWNDFDYVPNDVGQVIFSQSYISNATIANIKSLLTYAVRGERFSPGHWKEMIDEKVFGRILERLKQIGGQESSL